MISESNKSVNWRMLSYLIAIGCFGLLLLVAADDVVDRKWLQLLRQRLRPVRARLQATGNLRAVGTHDAHPGAS